MRRACQGYNGAAVLGVAGVRRQIQALQVCLWENLVASLSLPNSSAVRHSAPAKPGRGGAGSREVGRGAGMDGQPSVGLRAPPIS